MTTSSFIKLATAVLLSVITSISPVFSRTWFVSPEGDDESEGTLAAPFATPNKAVAMVSPGDTIFLRGGTYMLRETVRVKAAQNASEDARIYMWAYQEAGKAPEVPVLDGSQIPSTSTNTFKMSRCIYQNHEANYWHYKGLVLCHANDNGMKLEGSYNIVENCVFYGNNDTGLQIGMFKDFSIEETKSFPISGQPQFNPNYTYCRENIVLNCDSYYNYDSLSYGGTDDGGDADGFACKLFPGPGTEFYGCRAWNNSDDNWDLYMVYHPVVIDHCWSYKGGYDQNGVARGNGNGFKLGGGGSSGGAAFDQSVGAHLVRNCVSFACAGKGFDQNNAYEGMYIFNNLGFANAYNFRFPTEVVYGTMHLINNVGFGAEEKNHEFLSADKDGYVEPDASQNSWNLIDGCDLIKEGNKVNGVKTLTQDHTDEFLSLAVTGFMVARNENGSLPKNNFARIKEGSVFIDKGTPITNYALDSHSPGGLSLPALSIPYTGTAPDLGVYEVGDPDFATLTYTGNLSQRVFRTDSIKPVVFSYSGDGVTGAVATDLPEGLQATLDTLAATLTLNGVPQEGGAYMVSTTGAQVNASLSGEITLAEERIATLSLTAGSLNQTIDEGKYIDHIVMTWGGGATDVVVLDLSACLKATKDTLAHTLTIHGQPTETAAFSVSTLGGDGTVEMHGSIHIQAPQQVLAGWYAFQDSVLADSIAAYVSYSNAVINTTKVDGNGLGSIGALSLSKGTGTMKVSCTRGISALKMRFCITGDRQLTVNYGKTGTENQWTSGESKSIKKGSHEYDLVETIPAMAGIDTMTVNIVNSRSDGGDININDLYLATYASVVYDTEDPQGSPAGVEVSQGSVLTPVKVSMYQTETAVIVYGEIASLRAYDLNGRPVAYSQGSQILPTDGLAQGIYILRIETKEGLKTTIKFRK